MNLLHGASLVAVFVVAADPELEPVALVAAVRRPVEDRIVAHQELDPAAPGRIGLVDGPVVQNEDGEAEVLGQVPDGVGAGLPGVTGGDRRQLPEHRLGPFPRLLLAAGEAEVGVELTVGPTTPRARSSPSAAGTPAASPAGPARPTAWSHRARSGAGGRR